MSTYTQSRQELDRDSINGQIDRIADLLEGVANKIREAKNIELGINHKTPSDAVSNQIQYLMTNLHLASLSEYEREYLKVFHELKLCENLNVVHPSDVAA